MTALTYSMPPGFAAAAPTAARSRSVAFVRHIAQLAYLAVTVGALVWGVTAGSRITAIAAHEIVPFRHPDVLASDPSFMARRPAPRAHVVGAMRRNRRDERFLSTYSVSCAVGSVHDGDTLHCGRTRVRLRGIDAPEIPDQPGSVAARDALADLVRRGPVELTIVAEDATDQYGRTLAYLTVRPRNAAPIEVNETLALNGLAYPFHPRGAPRAAQDDRIDAAARVAAAGRRGVYGADAACRPVDFRHGRCGRAPGGGRY